MIDSLKSCDTHTLTSTQEVDQFIVDDLPVAYLEVDAQGAIVRMNQLARAMQDPVMGEIKGQTIWDMLPPAEREASRAAFEELMRLGGDPPAIVRSIFCRGEFRVHEIHRKLIIGDDGRPAGVRSITFDVTEIENARKSAQQAKDWMENILDSMTEGVLVTDALGFVRYLNPAGEELTGWKREEIVGVMIEEALPLVAYLSREAEELNFRMTVDHKWKGTILVLNHERKKLAIEISTSPVVDKNSGFTVGVLGTMRKSSVPVRE